MIGITNARTAQTGAWVRPSDWLPISQLVTAGDQKTVGLYAIYPTVNDANMSNTVALYATGNYTVNWGDGTIENFASGVQGQHLYDFAAINSSTLTSEGFKQAIITITPQTGQNLTNIQLGRKHTSVVYGRIASQWIDLYVYGTLLTTFGTGGTTYANLLKQATVYQTSNTCTNMASMFQYCSSLQSLNISNFNTAAVTSMTYMFYNCYSLQSLNLSNFNTAAVTNMTYMFYYCSSLQSLNISNFNTAAVTSMASMFQYCSSLQSLNISNFNTAAVTNMTYMFYNCSSLQSLNISQTTLAAVTLTANFVSFLGSNGSLTKCRLPNVKLSFTVASNPLSAVELNLLFGDLYDLTSQTAQTLTITGCTGAATCTKTIATNKNWIIIG